MACIETRIKTRRDGLAFIGHLLDSGLAYHFEDSAQDCLAGVATPYEIACISERVAELYALNWAELGCPIGAMLFLDGRSVMDEESA